MGTLIKIKREDIVNDIICVMKVLIDNLKEEYEASLRDGPTGHLAGYVIDQITGLCRLVDETVNSEPPRPRNDAELLERAKELVNNFEELLEQDA
jgi:hypothetical protein